MIIQPAEADDTMDDLKPYVELQAKRDISPGEIILSVQSIINLTTSIPEQVQARRHAGFADPYYCNSCASLMVVPRECTKKFEKRLVPSTAASLTEHSERPSSVPSSLVPSSPQDFMFCHPTHMIPTCSSTCRGLGRDFDHGICHTSIEKKIRLSHFNDINPRSLTDRNTQCLRDLIFLRLVTRAINLGKNPLGINDIMFATSGPDMRDIGYEEVEHWSFASHVVQPLRYLSDLFGKSNMDQFQNLAQIDGWVLNTLLVKINRVMNVSQTPRYVKYFRPDGMVDTAFGPNDDRWTHVPREPEDQSTWIASIDSLVCLVGVADPAKGETPNVTIVRREGVHVYAATAIKAGEPLLRAGNGAESPAAEEAKEIAMVAKGMEVLEQIREMEIAKERQDRMNESGDAEEPQDQSDEMIDAEDECSETKVDLEQYFDGIDEDRRNAQESQDQMDEQSTDTQQPQDQNHEMNTIDEDDSESRINIEQYFDAIEKDRRNAEESQDQMNQQNTDTKKSPDQSNEMHITEEEHSESRIDIEQYFDAIGKDRRNAAESQDQVSQDRMDESSDVEGGGAEGGAESEGEEGSEEENAGVGEDAMLIDELPIRHSDSVTHNHHTPRGQ